MFKETCWFLFGIKLGPFYIGAIKHHSEGEVCSVEFDWTKGLSKFLLGWFHTHPNQVGLSPSEEDQKTMRSWVRTLERPLICGIMNESKQEQKSYLFKRDKNKRVVYKYLKTKLIMKMFLVIYE